jgi:aminoglycoside phosphotransferase (APT) family kinase protein
LKSAPSNERRADTSNPEQPSGRTVALYPGAFRPPHRSHFEAVVNLAARPDIDEVVVIVANRYRMIPGTGHVLNTEVSTRIWSLYLQGLRKVRVEVAEGGAVQHAFDYLDRARRGDRVLFCVGESDFEQGDNRFANLPELAAAVGAQASAIKAPTDPTLRASFVRHCLAQGKGGKSDFYSALPDHLDQAQREEVWQICRQGMQDMHSITLRRVEEVVNQSGLGEVHTIESARGGKRDEVFAATLRSGQRVYVKYAFDTVSSASYTDPESAKPRSRLSVERRALKYLRRAGMTIVEIPEVLYFSKPHKTLILSEVCPGGPSLEEEFQRGSFDVQICYQVGKYLAASHAIGPTGALRNTLRADADHWQMALNLRTRVTADTPGPIAERLAELRQWSEQSRRPGLLHLDCSPSNVLIQGSKIGVIDHEFSVATGDPACDLGYLLGHTLAHLDDGNQDAVLEATTSLLRGYRETTDERWVDLQGRVLAFAAVVLLQRSAGIGCCQDRARCRQLSAMAHDLLLRGMHSVTSERATLDAVVARSGAGTP